MQGVVRLAPKLELKLDNVDEIFQIGEVLVVDTFSSSELPYTLDWIEFGAIGRQKVELEILRMQIPPGLVESSVVVLGIVDNHDDAAS
jgi:hypothetical protein